jgi:uncharacterized protein (UPF0332 family)
MEQVARLLEARAIALKGDPKEADLFGRSAFNRYYYAVFFITRGMLSDFDPKWRSTPHADVPKLLTGKVRKAIQQFKQRATRIGDSDSIAICSHALTSVDELSQLLKQGYSVRVTADYDPTIEISFAKELPQFSLGSTPVTTAQKWVDRAGFLTSRVRRAWNLANES